MKKKHLSALNNAEKWLKGQEVYDNALESAFGLIRKVLNSIPEQDKEVFDKLPLPKEIADEPATIALYSDGGCRGNPGPGAYAYVIQDHSGNILGEGVEYDAHTTNNKMELSGPLNGLLELKEVLKEKNLDPLLTKVKVVTDSKYVVDGMKSWVTGWKARGWKKADNKAPENLELWQSLDKVREDYMQIEWMWVKGHGGHPQNEYCDRKANEVMDENAS